MRDKDFSNYGLSGCITSIQAKDGVDSKVETFISAKIRDLGINQIQ